MKLILLIGLSSAWAQAMEQGKCLPIRGDLIRGEDLASLIPEFAAVSTRSVSPAPLAGAERDFSRAELIRLASRFGLPVLAEDRLPESACFAYPVSPLEREQVTSAIRKAMGGEAEFELTDFSLFPVPAGELVFRNATLRPNRRDGTRLLAGFVRYASGRQVPVWARVRGSAKPTGLVAAQELRPGMRLDATLVRIAPLEAGAGATLNSVSELEGLTPRRRIASGTVLAPNMLARAADISPGESVLVKVLAGAANLSFESRAETGGRTGDQILLRNPSSGQRFRAKVVGHGKASLTLGIKENR